MIVAAVETLHVDIDLPLQRQLEQQFLVVAFHDDDVVAVVDVASSSKFLVAVDFVVVVVDVDFRQRR